MLRAVLDVHGRALLVMLALCAWSLVALFAFVRGEGAWTMIGLPCLLAAALVFWPSLRSFRAASLVVIAGFYVGLVVLESAIRWSAFGLDALVYPARYTLDWIPMRRLDDSFNRYTFAPGFVGVLHGKPVRINRLGFRGADFTPAHPGVVRVMAFGSSITTGEGMNEDETYPHVLADLLAERTGAQVEGINCGVVSYGMDQALDMARETVPTYTPDVVVVEVRTVGGAIDPTRGRFPSSPPAGRSRLTRMSFARRALAIVPDHLVAVVSRLHRRPDPGTADDAPGALDRLEDGIERLAHPADGRRPEVVVLLITPLSDPEGSGVTPAFASRLEALSRRTGALVVDTAGIVKSSELPDAFVIFPGDAHPNARANARIAERVAGTLLHNEGFASTLQAARDGAPRDELP